MINLPSEAITNPLWVCDTQSGSDWFFYFDWLTGFELTKYKHQQASLEAGYSMFINRKKLPCEQLLLVNTNVLNFESFLSVWKSFSSPKTTFFDISKWPTQEFSIVLEKP